VLTRLDIAEPDSAIGQGKQPEKGERLGLVGEGQGVKVGIKWVDPATANFAAEWSQNVVHDTLPQRMFKTIKGTNVNKSKKNRTEEQKERRAAWYAKAREKNEKKQVEQAARLKAVKKAGRRKATFGVNKWQRAALAEGVMKTEGATPMVNVA
jgi:hypothetical protein